MSVSGTHPSLVAGASGWIDPAAAATAPPPMDPLTGLLTHSALYAALEREVERANEHELPLSVVMADITDFRTLNSVCGDDVGDFVLRMVADAIRSLAVAHGGLVSRFGSDEFVAVLPKAGPAAADDFVRGAEARIRTLKVPTESMFRLGIHVSFGAASLSDDIESPQELLAFAQSAMRTAHAKHEAEMERAQELRPAAGGHLAAPAALPAPPNAATPRAPRPDGRVLAIAAARAPVTTAPRPALEPLAPPAAPEAKPELPPPPIAARLPAPPVAAPESHAEPADGDGPRDIDGEAANALDGVVAVDEFDGDEFAGDDDFDEFPPPADRADRPARLDW